AKQMPTVIESECTGSELCLEPCPVDCIDMVALGQDISTWKWPFPASEMPRPEPVVS
ncbi:MAG TPA: electron transport complex subunit RsxB, partial [Thioalkalivibrio sp.]|nr:electron transport complex subunit RsxB [Thioalkalivibrio sp.]